MHAHDWRISFYLLLSFPEADGMAERCVSFRCATCGHEEGWTASWPLGQRILYAGVLAQHQRQEQATSSPYGWMARKQDMARRPW
jgi:hypothetical protein